MHRYRKRGSFSPSSLHSFTEINYTSAFDGIGKVKALNIIFDLNITSKPPKKLDISSH